MNTNELLQAAIGQTKNNIVKKTRTKSINHRIEDLLKDGRKLTRVEIVGEITLNRLQETEEKKITKKSFEDAEFIERFNKMNKTVKNGVDTALSPNSKSNAAFSSNPAFEQWSLQCDDENKYYLTLKEVK